MEARRLLSATYWVNDNWVVTAPPADVGSAPLIGDIVANTGAGDDGSVTGKTFGTNAFATLRDALAVANSNDTIDILAGFYSFANPIQISQQVTIVGQAYGGGETLSGANGVLNIAANVTVNGSGGFMTFLAASGADPFGSGFSGAAAVLAASGTGSTITGCNFSFNAIGIGVTTGLSSYTISGDSFYSNQVGVVAMSNGTIGTGNTFDGDNVVGPHQSQGVYVGSGATVTVSGSTFRNLNAATATAPGGIVVDGGSSVTSTGNQFYNDTIGIRVVSGTLDSSSDSIGANTGSANATGVLALAGSTTLSSDTIANNTIGVDAVIPTGSLSLDHNRFSIGSTVNTTDLKVESGAGPVTIGTGNSFSGSTYYVDNLSVQNFDLSSNGTTFVQTSPYTIEDKIYDVIDQAGLGLVRIQAGAVFVSDTVANPSGAIARAEAAALGNVVYVQAQNSFAVPVSPTVQYGAATFNLTGTVSTVDGSNNPLPFLVPSGNVAITVNGNTDTVAVNSSGQFSDVLNTQSITGSSNIGVQYPITYTFLGDGTVIYSLTGTGSFDPVTNIATELTVTKATVTANITVQNKTYDGTTNATLVSDSLSGVVAGDSVSLSVGVPTFVSKNANPAAVATATASISGPQVAFYQLASTTTTTTATIAPIALTVTATPNTKNYDGTTFAAAIPVITSGSLVGTDTATWSETYDTKNVGANKTLIPAGIIIDGNGGNNYAVTLVTNTAGVITARAITVTAQPNTKVYDGTTSASTAPTVTSGSLQGTDTVGLTEVYGTRNVGTGLTLFPTGAVNDGNNGNNYTVTLVPINAGVITIRLIVVTAVAGTSIYGDPLPPPKITGGLGAGDTANFIETYNNRNVGTGKTLTPSGTINDGNGGKNYSVTFVAAYTGVITPRPITVTAVANSKVYDGTTSAAAVPTIGGPGLVFADTPAFTESYASPNVGTNLTLIPAGFVNDGNNGNNYSVTFVSSNTGVINGIQITVSATPYSKVYDGTTSAPGATPPTIPGWVSISPGDTYTFSESFANKNAGNESLIPSIVITGPDSAAYSVTYVDAPGTISPRPITVSPPPITITYGDPTTVTFPFPPGILAPGDTGTFSETFLNRNAGTWPVTLSCTINDGNGGNNYTVTKVSVEGTILPRSIVVQATANTKVYDGTTSAFATPVIISGNLVSGDAAAFTETYDTRNVGTNKTLIPAGGINDGNNGNNYSVTFVPVNGGVITARAITVTASPNTKIYDGTTSAAAIPVITSGSLAPGDTAGFTESCGRNVGTGLTLIPAGSVSDGNGGNNYAVTFQPANTGVIFPRPITVTAVANTKTYDGTTSAAAVPTITTSAPPPPGGTGPLGLGDTAYFIETYDNPNVGTGKTLTPSGSVNDGNGGNNYAVTFVNDTTGVIMPRAIVVTATPNTKVYDGTTSAVAIPAFTSGSLVSGDTANFSETYNNRNVGTGKTLTPSGTVNDGNGGNNYAVTFQSANTGVITPAPITVTFTSASKTYDGTTFSPAKPIISGVLGAGDTAAFTENYLSPNVGTNLTLTPGGTVNDGNGGNNYAVTFVDNTTGVITPLALVVQATANSKVYDGTTSASAIPVIISGSLQGTDSATWTESYGSKNVGTGLTLIPAGSVNGGSAGNYAVTFVPVNAGVITARAIEVVAVGYTMIYGSTSPPPAPSITPSLEPGDTSGFIESFGGRNVGTWPAIPSGSAIDGNNGNDYSVTFRSGMVTILPRPITVAAAANTKVDDGTTSAAAVPTIGGLGLVFADTPAFTESYASPNVGTNLTLTPGGTVNDGNGGNNYTVTFVDNTTGVITPLAIVVTATANAKVYDGTTSASATPVIISGRLVSGDTAAFTESYASPNAGAGLTLIPAGTVIDGNGGNNYTVTFATASTGVITPASLTISANNQTMVYGGPLPTLTASYSGFVNGDSPASLTTLPTLSTTAAVTSPLSGNPYSITANGAADPNYIITYVPGTLTVTVITWVFDSSAELTFTNNLPNGSPVGSITFWAGAGSYVVNGNRVDFSGDITSESPNVQKFDLPLTLVGGGGTINTASGDLTITGDISESGGSFGITKTGSGTLFLSGVNSYTGGTTVNNGAIVITNASAFSDGTSLTVEAGGTFVFDPSSAGASTVTSATTAAPVTANVVSLILVLPPPTAVDVVKHSTSGRNSQWPMLPPAALEPPQSVPVAALGTPAKRNVVDVAWLAQATNSSNTSDQQRTKDVEILALEAVFSQYVQ